MTSSLVAFWIFNFFRTWVLGVSEGFRGDFGHFGRVQSKLNFGKRIPIPLTYNLPQIPLSNFLNIILKPLKR
jgi:hypothetical protein